MLDADVLKDKKGKRPSAILNKFLILHGVDWTLWRDLSVFEKSRFCLSTRTRENSCLIIDRFHRIRVEESRIRKEKVTFSNENRFV